MSTRQLKMTLFSLVLSTAIAVTGLADVFFGFQPWREDLLRVNLADQGQFFATSDYDYVPEEKDKYMDGMGRRSYTRGNNAKEVAMPPPSSKPWLSGEGDVLFGVDFKKSPEAAEWKSGPVKVDRLIVQWRGNVPKPGDFGGFIVDHEGNRIRLPLDKAMRIYPYDVTDIRFSPTTIKALYLGKRNGIVEVERIIILPAYERAVTNGMRVRQNECYSIFMSPLRPGTVKSLIPANPGIVEWPYSPGMFLNSLSSYIEIKGKRIYAQTAVQPVDIREARDGDEIEFTLQFAVPEPLPVKVRLDCSRDENKGISIKYSCADLPKDACLGVELNCATGYFPGVFPAENRFELSGGAHSFDTTIGKLDLKLDGVKTLVGQRGQKGSPVGEKDIQLSGLAAGKTVSLTILPPFLSKIKYPEMPVVWYDSPAGNTDSGATAPFRKEDLELLEVIDCGNAADPHACYDIVNDPLIKEKNGPYSKSLEAYSKGLEAIKFPEKGRVPIVEIGGRKCRAIGDYYGTYIRYDLKTPLERDVPYLLVIEHAFDKLRRGTFGIQSSLYPYQCAPVNGGLDTGIFKHDGKYYRENVMFQNQHDFSRINPAFLWICNVWKHNSGWLKSDGPAVSKIEIYKVKRIPKLAFGAALPEPSARRHVGILTQSPTVRTLREDSWLVGFDQVWVDVCPPANLAVGYSAATTHSDCGEGPFNPGTPEGYQWMLERFRQTGINHFNVYLSHLLKHGTTISGKTRTAFARFGITEPAPGYEADAIPFKPTREEQAFISKALKAAMEKFGQYDSLDMIGTGECELESSLSFRNLSDFVKDTGARLESSPVPLENLKRILNSDPETRRSWMEWAGKNRFLKNKMLLDELRKYRPAAALMLNSSWLVRVEENTYFYRKGTGLQDAMDKAGIASLGDYLKLLGFDWTLYKGVPGFAFQIDAPFPAMTLANYGRLMPDTPCAISNYYQEAWFADFKDSFSEGLSIYLNLCYLENETPFNDWSVCFMKNKMEMRQAMVEAALQNPRWIYLSSYNNPWQTRTEDVRTFAAPFRLLPFSKPTESDIGIQGPAGVSIRKYGQRYALFNAKDESSEVILTLPKGTTDLYDLSSGSAEKMASSTAGGLTQVKITMEPWSMKTLASETR